MCRDVCLFIFFSSFRLLLFVVRYYYIYVYIYSKLKFMEIFFFFLLYHKRTRLRSVGREISLRSRREETEKDRDGRKGFGTASCGSLFFPFFFLKPETHLSAVVFQKETEGMRKQLRQM